jgi:RNA polymerase sigma-70 factor (ECF subfamily)
MGKDWALVQQAIAGDADAQEQLFAPHTRRLYRIVFALLPNKEDAEDALQDGLCKAFTSLRSFQGRSSFSTWLTRIVMNSALMARRRKRVHPEASLDEILDSQPEWLPQGVVDPRPDPETIYAGIEINALVEEHVRQLPPALQAAFRLQAVNGLSTIESSQALGIRANTFKSRTCRARRKLACGLKRSLEVSTIALMFGRRGHLMSQS